MDSLFFMHSLKMLRYLIAWRVNTSLVRLPINFSAVLSKTLGNAIADLLSTKDSRQWRKSIDIERQQQFNASTIQPDNYPESLWPIHAILLPHTLKRNYGVNEIILWELKLLGDSADHGFFLETILPAMEQLSCGEIPDRRSRINVWGHFDIHNIWIANGNVWDPLISDGNLNLRYHPKLLQWKSHINEQTYCKEMTKRKRLVFIRPFAFDHENISHIKDQFLPDMSKIIESVIRRWSFFTSGNIKQDLWDLVPPSIIVEVRKAWETSCMMRIHSSLISPALNDEPGLWKGELMYEEIPFFLLPYLDMASIIHIGKKTHYGCGTFTMC